jgi:tRNA nucleotidyltransferase (CCA-adding enzyme)
MAEILIDRGIQLTPFEATTMALGLYEETGSLRFTSTTEDDLKIAAYLLSAGADLSIVSDFIEKELSREQIFLLHRLISNLKNISVEGIGVAVSTADYPSYVPDLALLTHKIKDMENLDVLFTVVRMGERIYTVGRSRVDTVNVGGIMAKLGGGGHSKAASATLRNRSLQEAERDILALLHGQIDRMVRAKDIMSQPVQIVHRDMKIREVKERMMVYRHGGFPVFDKRKMVGIVTRSDIDKALHHRLGDMPISTCMSTSVISVTPETPLPELKRLMTEHDCGRLPVISGGNNLRGIITRSDIVTHLASRQEKEFITARGSSVTDPANLGPYMKQRLVKHILALLVEIGAAADEIGMKVFVVGGFVRDLILGEENMDIDIVVEGNGIEFARYYCTKKGAHTVEHDRFQTALIILPDGFKIDIATARIEQYPHPAALPVVESSVIKYDMYRRDFTINSMAIALNEDHWGHLIDYFGGRRDIKIKKIRVLHNLSFFEDPTRILRATRFQERYGFEVDSPTLHLMKQAIDADVLTHVSPQRIREELVLTLKEKDPFAILARMSRLGVFRSLGWNIRITRKMKNQFRNISNTLAWYRIQFFDEEVEPWLLFFLGFFYRFGPKKAFSICKSLNVSKRAFQLLDKAFVSIPRISRILASPEGKPSRIYKTLRGIPREILLFAMARGENENINKAVSQYLNRLRKITLLITGDDLKEMGIPPGPIYKRILDHVKAEILDRGEKDRDAQLSSAMECYEKMHSQS